MGDFLQTRYREITFSAVVFGVLVGAVMNAAITYAGLKIGFTLGGSAIAAVLGFGVLRGVLRRGTILETNIGQTVASAVNTSNSGVIFTVPVLFLTGHDMAAGGADFWLITLACSAGAVLGAALIIPLRKQMIDIERLRFPTGTAVASILKSPGAGPAKALVLLAGIAVGMAIFFPTQLGLLKIGALGGHGLSHLPVIGIEADLVRGFVDDETVDVGKLIGLPSEMQLVFAIAPFALGAGYLTGRAGLYVLAGGLLAFFVINPLAFRMEWMPATVSADAAAQYGYGAYNRPLGIGLLLGGALMGILASLPAIVQAFRSVGAARRVSRDRVDSPPLPDVVGAGGSRASGSRARQHDELGMRVLGAAAISAVVLLYLAADLVGNRPINDHCPVTGEVVSQAAPSVAYQGYRVALASEAAVSEWQRWDAPRRADFLTSLGARPGWLARFGPHLRAAIIAAVGALWIWFAGVIIAQCTGMTDWSPISGMALLTVVLVLMLAGTGAVVGAVLIGAALCVAITLAADMMQDLKTGFLVGAQPKRQQTIELMVVGIGPVISMVTLMLIVATNRQETGLPLGPGTATVAPQAQALQAVIVGVQGGELPYALYAMGGVMGMVLGAGAFSGLGVLIGLSMYLPFHYIATYGIGCLANMCVARIRGRTWAEEWGVPFCAGLIVGESTLALVINMFILMRGGGG